MSPLPFGFNRVPDNTILLQPTDVLCSVSIAFRLQPRSRQREKRIAGIANDVSPLPFGFNRVPDLGVQRRAGFRP